MKNSKQAKSFYSLWDTQICKHNLFTPIDCWDNAVCIHFPETHKIAKLGLKKIFHGTPQYEYGPFVPPSSRTISRKISKNLQMCAFFGILGMGLSNEQCENCLVWLVALYVNCVLKLQFCFAFDEQLQAYNFVTIHDTIFLFLELSVPLQEKTSMKWISYQISTSYNELYLINSGISGREREREREREKFYVINVKYKEISWRVRGGGEERKKVTSRSTE